MSEGSFLVQMEIPDNEEESRINVAKIRTEIPGMMSMEPLESEVPVVIDNEFEPSAEVLSSYDETPSTGQPDPNQDTPNNNNLNPAAAPADPQDPKADADSEDGGGGGVPVIYVAIGVGVALCGVIAAALLMYRRSSTRGKGPETGLPTVTPDGTSVGDSAHESSRNEGSPFRRASLLSLLPGGRKASTISSENTPNRKASAYSIPGLDPTDLNLSFSESVAVRDRRGSIITGKRLSVAETEEVFRSNSKILQSAAQQPDTVVLVAENSRRGSTFFNKFQHSEQLDASAIEGGVRVASSGEAKKRRRWSLPWQTAEPHDASAIAQATPALGSPNNRRGSTQVIALHADISCGDSDALQFGELGLDEFMFGGPRVAEPGQSLAYRPPVRPAAASGAAAGGSTALKNIKGADKLLSGLKEGDTGGDTVF